MAKRKKGKPSRKQAQNVNKKQFKEAQRATVADWLNHMCRHLEKSIALSEQLDEGQLDEDNHQFWALVKYAENVQECIIQLDNLNKSILRALDEVPLEANPEFDFSWTGMKGMRQRLAHDFRRIDPVILWQTVTKDFPILLSLMSKVYLVESSRTREGTFSLWFKAGVFRNLPAFEDKDGPKPGNTIIGLLFDERGEAQCVRLGKINDRTMAFKTTDGMAITELRASLVDEGGNIQNLGGWSKKRAK